MGLIPEWNRLHYIMFLSRWTGIVRIPVQPKGRRLGITIFKIPRFDKNNINDESEQE
jgi:hypothetical protein